MAGKKKKRIPALEWVSAGIGAVITATMFGFLSVEAIKQRDGIPPLMEVAPVRVVQAKAGYIVEFEVRNRARKTGASVEVEGTLESSGEEAETSTATLSYVPGQSVRRGGLLFTSDPRESRLKLRVTGYERP